MVAVRAVEPSVSLASFSEPYSPKTLYRDAIVELDRRLRLPRTTKDEQLDHSMYLALCDEFESSLLQYLRHHYEKLEPLSPLSRQALLRKNAVTLRVFSTVALMIQLQLIALTPSDQRILDLLQAFLTEVNLIKE